MEKKVSKTIGFVVGVLIGLSIGALFIWQAETIKKKNKEIASLKEELSQAQTDHFIDVIRFGQWKLQVEQLAEENGWELPELSESATLTVPGPKIEGHLETEVEGDSLVVRSSSTKVVEE
jgi:hypothetical protein